MTERVFPGKRLALAGSALLLREFGLPPLINIVASEAGQHFFDFSATSASIEATSVEGLSEPVLLIGKYCTWIRSIGYFPPGGSVVMGVESGWVWYLEETASGTIPWSMNSSTYNLERCILRYAAFCAAYPSDQEADAAFAILVRDMREIDPQALAADQQKSLWRSWLHGVALDLAAPFSWD